MAPAIPEELLERLRAALHAGRKIEAVRLYREWTGADLSAATAFCAALEGELRRDPAGPRLGRPAGGRLAAWVYTVGGILFGVWGVSLVVPPVTAPVGRAEARVVREDQNGELVVVFQYRADGREYLAKQPHNVTSHWVGEAVPVVYEAADPAVACIDRFPDRWVVPAFVTGTGLVFAVVGVVWIRKSVGPLAR